MKRVIVMLVVAVAMVGAADVMASKGTLPGIACTVGTNGKCVYPEANLKDKHIFQRLQKWLRNAGPRTDKP